MTAQLTMFAAPPEPVPEVEQPQYGWDWVGSRLHGIHGKTCSPREGVRVFIEPEYWHDGGVLQEEHTWAVMGCGGYKSGIAPTFDEAAEAARKVVGEHDGQKAKQT